MAILQKYVFVHFVLCQFCPAGPRVFEHFYTEGQGTRARMVLYGAGQLVFPVGQSGCPWFVHEQWHHQSHFTNDVLVCCLRACQEWRCVYNVGQKACPLLKHLNISRKLFDSNSRVSSWLGPMIYWSATMDKCTAVSQDRCALSHLSTLAIYQRDNYKAITAAAQK